MGFYDEIAKGVQWEISSNVDFYLKVVANKLQLPNPKWLQFHLNYLDKVIEAIHAFRNGVLTGLDYDITKIQRTVIENPEEALRFLRNLQENYKVFSVDIESSNLSTDKMTNKVLCIGVAYEEDKGVSFTRECFLNKEFHEEFQRFNAREDFVFILHNGVFDISRTQILEGIQLKIDEDTLLKHYCGINEHKGTHKLKELAQLYLGFPDWEKPLDEWKRKYCREHKIKLKDFQYDYFPQRLLAEYNVIDCCATFQLNTLFDKLIRERPLYLQKTNRRCSILCRYDSKRNATKYRPLAHFKTTIRTREGRYSKRVRYTCSRSVNNIASTTYKVAEKRVSI